MNKELLPIGTVLLLEGGSKKVMITGYCSKDDNEIIYDYNGCIFPEGLMENKYVLFNSNQIEDIYYKGLDNAESKDYVQRVNSLLQDKNGIAGLEDVVSNSNSDNKLYNRAPKEPTNPMSKSEMKARYTKETISGNQTNKFNVDKLN